MGHHPRTNRSANPHRRHRFPPAIIQYAVWLYHRLNLGHRDIEDLLAERGIGNPRLCRYRLARRRSATNARSSGPSPFRLHHPQPHCPDLAWIISE